MKIKYKHLIPIITTDENKIIYYSPEKNQFYMSRYEFVDGRIKLEQIQYSLGLGFACVTLIRILQIVFPKSNVVLLFLGFLLMEIFSKRILQPVRERIEEVDSVEGYDYFHYSIIRENFKQSLNILVVFTLFLLLTIILSVLYFCYHLHIIGLLAIGSSLPCFILYLLGTVKRVMALGRIYVKIR